MLRPSPGASRWLSRRPLPEGEGSISSFSITGGPRVYLEALPSLSPATPLENRSCSSIQVCECEYYPSEQSARRLSNRDSRQCTRMQLAQGPSRHTLQLDGQFR